MCNPNIICILNYIYNIIDIIYKNIYSTVKTNLDNPIEQLAKDVGQDI